MTDFAPVGGVGTASDYDFGTNILTMNPSANVPVGDIIIAWVSCTSHYFFGPDGQQIPETSFTDSVGNRWQQLVNSYVFDAHVAAYICRLKYALTTGDTITLEHFGGGAKCISLHQFTFPTTKRFGFYLDNLSTVGISSDDPQAISIGSLDANREYLLVHVLGAEGPDTDTYTWDSDYTQIAGIGTTGNGTADGNPPTSDYHVRGGFRIITGVTGDTVDVTNDSGARDTDQALIAITPLFLDDDYPNFPNTPLIDDFNRADEDPADGGIWDSVTSPHPQFGDKWLQVISNQVAEGAGTSGGGSMYTLENYESEEDSAEYEIWGTAAVAHYNDLGFGIGDGAANEAAQVGVAYAESSFRVDAEFVVFGDFTFSGEMPSGVNCLVWGARANDTKLGFQQLNVDLFWEEHLFMDEGDGWEWIACVLRTSLGSFYPTGQFFIAFEGSATSRVDDFGGGMLGREAPRIIRRLPVQRKFS